MHVQTDWDYNDFELLKDMVVNQGEKYEKMI